MVRLAVLVRLQRSLQDMLTQLERQLWRRPAIVQHMVVRPQSPVLAHLTVVPALEADPVVVAATVAVTGHQGQRDQPQMPAILTRCQHSLLPWLRRVDLKFNQLPEFSWHSLYGQVNGWLEPEDMTGYSQKSRN